MKKNTRKLPLRSETIRALRTLDDIDLIRIVGGSDFSNPVASQTQSGITCPVQVTAVPK
jgi:hypothetical protein